jgi:hypothetical protein
MLCRPHAVLASRPFFAMFLLYGGTYATANVLDTISAGSTARDGLAEATNWTKFGAVSITNMCLSLHEDNQFAKAFGAGTARALPVASYAPFVLPDGITIFASFNLPPLLASLLPEVWEKSVSRLSVAQLLAPAASQIAVTPLHLLGLDLYHRRNRLPFLERARAMRRGWASSCLARMARVVPELALGNVVNTRLRASWASA